MDQGANPAGGDAPPNKQKDENIPEEESNPKDVQAQVEVIPEDAEVEVEVEVQASVEVLPA